MSNTKASSLQKYFSVKHANATLPEILVADVSLTLAELDKTFWQHAFAKPSGTKWYPHVCFTRKIVYVIDKQRVIKPGKPFYIRHRVLKDGKTISRSLIMLKGFYDNP